MVISNIIIGTGTGLVTSFLIWFAFTRIVRPKLSISKAISKTSSLVNGTPLFRIKIENLSCFRAYDLCLTGRIKIYNLLENYPNRPRTYVLNVGAGNHPYIENKCENKSSDISGREFLIRPTKLAKSQLSVLWGISKANVNIEKILKMDPRNAVEVSVTATHGFSGAKKRTFTQQYRSDSIHSLYFSSKGVDLIHCDNANIAIEEDAYLDKE